MSLETVVDDIRARARERADEIIAEAEDRADDIVAEAEADAEETVAEAERAVERRIEQERDRELSSATLEAKQARLEARRDVLEAVRADVEADLESMEGERREALTRALLEAAIGEFDDVDEAAVYGRDDDADLLESLLEAHDGFSYAGGYDCLGGVVVESEGSRLRVNNTFDSLLEDVWEDELRTVSERLIEQR